MDDRTPNALRLYLSGFNTWDALLQISRRAASLLGNRRFIDNSHRFAYSADALAYLADQVLRHSNPESSIPMGEQELLHACSCYTRLKEYIETVTPQSHPTENLRSLLRLSNLQYPYQEEFYIAWPRIGSILIDQPLLTRPESSEFIQQSALSVFTLSISELLRIGALLTASITKFEPNYLNLDKLSESRIPGFSHELNIATLRRFVRAFGLTRLAYKETHHRFRCPPEFEKYRFLELQAKPVVIVDDFRVIVPSPHLLVWGLSTGVFFSLSDYARGLGRRSPFKALFGHLFQEYVGRILKEAPLLDCKGWELIPEFRSGVSDSVDWILVKGEVAILIECKSSRLRLESRAFVSGEEFEADAKKCYLKPLQQIRDFARALKEGRIKREPIKGCKRLIGAVVHFEPLRLANSAYPQLYESQTSDVYNWVDAVQFLSVEELERLMSLRDLEFLDILDKKLNEASGDEWSNFLMKSYPVPDQHPVLKAKLEQLFPGLREFRNDKAEE